ncbi:MAG TPA: hypothetical protein DCL80_10785 [Balneola sp.]|nr:hypothetical protein [Balneola sp.]MAO76385.1 hypothetical protein [Balneola sp.]MBF65576.1 hypothetical protein [Balneola sp.]HAH51710.1 hypothetical protein [Balneola sp.]HAW79801.1 hypothetical protein [Balneola sp.]
MISLFLWFGNQEINTTSMKSLIRNTTYLMLILILFSGCFLQSLHPLITKEKAELIKGLEGRWETEDSRWTFFRDSKDIKNVSLSGLNVSGDMKFSFDEGDGLSRDGKGYFVIFEDLNNDIPDSVLLEARVGRINNTYYMDITVSDIFRDVNFENFHLFPVHTFSKINIEGDNLNIELFKSDWISDLILENRVRIKHETIGENVLITASTEELNKFVEKYGEDEKAYEDPINLKRRSNEL